jgi:hypothetical protein
VIAFKAGYHTSEFCIPPLEQRHRPQGGFFQHIFSRRSMNFQLPLRDNSAKRGII